MKTFFQSYQQVVVELHDVLPAEVEDEHHVEVDEVGAERQATQRRQERPGQDPVDDTFNGMIGQSKNISCHTNEKICSFTR